VPTWNEANVRHLLRRTEFVDRNDRVTHLMGLGSIEAAVDDIMNVAANPPSASFADIAADENWQQGVRISEHWLDQMATVARPFGERMAFYWHGHICSELGKVNSGTFMREQIDLFRRRGLGTASDSGNISSLMVAMSLQVAMLRYLDNDRNVADSPNQNFARELMELFLLGVGNYNESDVEASTAAWTGHTAHWETGVYSFSARDHQNAPQVFLGKTINAGSRPYNQSGFETIEVVLGTGPLGSGTVPVGADKNVGRPTNQVAAEFLSKKLWQGFGEAASGSVPSGVLASMTGALLSSGFNIRPWVRAMLVHDDFYTDATKIGLVRQPVEYVVALMVATGLKADEAGQLWLMERTGQQLLYPPNVSGWRPNGYWVNASAMGARQQLVQGCMWRLTDDTWDGAAGYTDLPHGRLTKSWLESADRTSAEVVDRMLVLTGLTSTLSAATRQRIIAHLDSAEIQRWMRFDALLLILSSPEMHIAA
jgi:uncharacterized protein (DUF1800 family)